MAKRPSKPLDLPKKAPPPRAPRVPRAAAKPRETDLGVDPIVIETPLPQPSPFAHRAPRASLHLDPRHPIETIQSSVRFARDLHVGEMLRDVARVAVGPDTYEGRQPSPDAVATEQVIVLGDASPTPPTPPVAPTAPSSTGRSEEGSWLHRLSRVSTALAIPFRAAKHVDEPYDPSPGSVAGHARDAAPSSRSSWPLSIHLRARGRFFAAVAFASTIALVGGDRARFQRILDHLQPGSHPIVLERPALAAPVVIEASASPCPSDMALVAADEVRVCVDKFEASLVETVDGKERAYSPYLPVEGHDVKAISRAGTVPQAYISRDQAEVACRNAGKRLCEPVEWRTACEGPQHTVYPYGDSEDANACNTHGRAPLGVLFGGYGDLKYDFRVMNDSSLNALDGTVAKTGSFEKCTNGFGVHDMVGNVHEWTAEHSGTFRGGYYLDTHLNGDGCRYQTTAHAASYHDYSTGFRCCRDADASE
ncbi:MAG: formylglycine-generating enzyme family protein [Polyangiales bacterium]